jgi:hypothetical protein
MNTITTQEWAGMLGESVTKSVIGISTAPGEDGNAINNEIAGPDESTMQRGEDYQGKKCFWQQCPRHNCPLPSLRGTGNARTAISHRYVTSQGQNWPVT